MPDETYGIHREYSGNVTTVSTFPSGVTARCWTMTVMRSQYAG